MAWSFSIIALILGAAFAMAKNDTRTPAQAFPDFPTTPPATTQPIGGSVGLMSEDVVQANGARVQSVFCLFGGTSGYSISGAAGNDIRISRVTAGGDIRYEVFKGSRFLGSCPAVHVVSNN